MAVNTTEKSDTTTRDRLLESAVDVFGKYGFEAATTRMIAKAAGVNIAAIPYYFNGKEGLYQAAVTHIVEKIEARAGATLQNTVSLATRKDLSPDMAEKALEALLEAVVTFMVGSPDAPRIARMILREQLDPSSAYDIIYNRVMTRIIDSIASFLVVIRKDMPVRSARLRAMSLIGQVMAFRVARETIVRMAGLEGYTPSETEEIRNIVLEHTRAVVSALGTPHRERRQS